MESEEGAEQPPGLQRQKTAQELSDEFGAELLTFSTVSITIVSGLEATPAVHTVWEETRTPLALQGINQRPGDTWFVITGLPAHGAAAREQDERP